MKWKLWNLGTNYLRIAHHVGFPVQGTPRFPTMLIKTYEDIWRACLEHATSSDIKASEEDWRSTFNVICATKKTMIVPPDVRYAGPRILQHESLVLQAFKRRVDAQWDWMKKPPEKFKKKKVEGEEYVFLKSFILIY